MYAVAMFSSAIILTIPTIKLCPEKVHLKELIAFIFIVFTLIITTAWLCEFLIPVIGVVCTGCFVYLKLKNMLLSFILAIFTIMIGLVSDYMSAVIFILVLKIDLSKFLSDIYHYCWYATIIWLFSFIISSIIEYIFNKKLVIRSIHFVGPQSIVMCGLCLGSIVMFYVMTIFGEQYSPYNRFILINSTIIPTYFLITMTIIFYLFVSSNKDSELKYKDELLRNVSSYNLQLEEMYSSIRRFKHDHSNIMLSMSMYLLDKKYDELEEYFFKTISSAGQGQLSDTFQWDSFQKLKVIEIKGIIASKLVFAQEKNILFTVEIPEEITQVYMNVLDLNIIVGILLDNAIEASIQCDEPYIKIGIIKKEDAITFVIINNFRDSILDINMLFEEGVSSKGDGRGLGLFNLKSIIKQYDDVFLEISTEKNEFKVVLEIENGEEH